MKKKFLTLFLATMLTLSLAACGKEDSNNTSGGSGAQVEAGAKASDGEAGSVKNDTKDVPPVVENPIEEALKNMNSVDSMEAQMVMEMDMVMSANGEEMALDSVTTMDMVCFYDTLKIKMDMTMDMGALGTQQMSVYADTTEDGNLTTYMYDGEQWYSEVSGAVDLEEYDARRNMSDNIGDTSVYKEEGMEQVNGANAYKYSYAMTGDEMKEALLSSGSLDSLASLGINESQLDGMLDDLGEIVTYVWVDEATLYPVKYEMDMTDVMDTLMVNMIEAMGDQADGMSIRIPKLTMTMTCFNYNNATDFTVPDEAKHTN